MNRRPPISTRSGTLVPYTTLFRAQPGVAGPGGALAAVAARPGSHPPPLAVRHRARPPRARVRHPLPGVEGAGRTHAHRSEEPTSELQSLMRISYAVFCMTKKTTIIYLPIYSNIHPFQFS